MSHEVETIPKEVNMNYLSLFLVFALIFAACTTIHPIQEEESMLSNKEKVIALLKSIENGAPEPVGYINPDKYIQHNLAVADGIEGFAEVLKQLPAGSAKANVLRAFQDGDYVFTHTAYDFFGPKVGFDIFRFENGQIVEHWDNLQELATGSVSGRSQIDGPIEVEDPDKTAENKTLVDGFVQEILMGGNPGKITDYISPEKYYQHNPAVADGLDGLGKALQKMAETGMPMRYTKNHMLLGQGNFVLTASEGQFLGKHVAFYDLFRIEDRKIVEHWDTIEQIPLKENWKNNNGKF
jgi:predicted SnoaL-like aldol condensation-catalyzing enzyme